VIREDSLGLRGKAIRCLACDAFAAMVVSYQEEDSLVAAVRIAREWTRLQPGERRPWVTLAGLLAQSGRIDEGFAALRIADSLDPRTAEGWRSLAALDLSADRYSEAEELARSHTRTGPAAERYEGYWLLAIALRHRGQMKEALAAARQYRALVAEKPATGSAPTTALLEAQVLREAGQFRAAAALFDSIGRQTLGLTDPAVIARHRVWTWAHMAGASAAAGDTAGLAALADSAQFLGQRSAFVRDQRLHFYLRGLLASARGDHALAATHFQSAISSPNMGYTRINYALAGELLALRRPREAVATLQSVMRGIFEGSNLYLTHTEAAERLAQAFDAAGQRDSAAYYYSKVTMAWEHADAMFTPRLLEARGKFARLVGRR
jgi:tetratricopeptide (TPR) repeat protein